MEPSIFTRIIDGEIPSHKIYEDDHFIAILDIQPMHTGHTLVIPKVQVAYIWDLDEEVYSSLMSLVRQIGKQLRDIMETEKVGILVDGSDVAHVHVHVIPFNSGLYASRNKAQEPDHEELGKVAKKIKETLHV